MSRRAGPVRSPERLGGRCLATSPPARWPGAEGTRDRRRGPRRPSPGGLLRDGAGSGGAITPAREPHSILEAVCHLEICVHRRVDEDAARQHRVPSGARQVEALRHGRVAALHSQRHARQLGPVRPVTDREAGRVSETDLEAVVTVAEVRSVEHDRTVGQIDPSHAVQGVDVGQRRPGRSRPRGASDVRRC